MSAHLAAALRVPPTLVDAYTRRFPWYEDLLQLGKAADRGLLRELPLVDGAVLAAHYYNAQDETPDLDVYLTSGTSGGTRKRILYGKADDDLYCEHRRELFGRFTSGVGAGSVAAADLGTGHAAASARRVFEALGFDTREIDFQAPLAEHVEKLNAWNPAVLFTMPMILDRLMTTTDDLSITPKKIMVVGDLAPEPWRANVAEHFGLAPSDVLDVFGSIEIGAIGYSDSETGLYHFHDHITPEVIDPADYRAGSIDASPEGDGLLLLTSTARPNFPAIRYVTGDAISGLRRIEHGNRLVFAFDRIEGRVDGDAKHGERISGHDIASAVARVFPGSAFEVVDDGGLRIRVASDQVDDVSREALRASIADAAPDVATMVRSGLVRPVDVVGVKPADLVSGHAKRRFNLRKDV